MVVYLSFEEAQAYVSEHFGQRVELSAVNTKELSVAYVKRMLIKDVRVGIDINIDEVKSDQVTVSYKGGMALDMMISGALSLFLDKLPELSAGITKEEDHHIRVNLSEIKKTKAMMKFIALRDIEVEEKGLKVTMVLK